jgi:hypothetical protein
MTMNKISRLLALFALVTSAAGCGERPEPEAAASEGTALSRFPDVAEKDLAVAWPLDTKSPVRASDAVQGGALLPRSWYRTVSQAFARTDVGEALEGESLYEDWQLISMRVAPCSALGSTPSSDVTRLCWPEVRLVWQPVVRNVTVHARFSPAFAEDRAFHALYDVAPELALGAADAARARTLLARIKKYASTWAGGAFAPLAASELTELEVLRDRVVVDLLNRARALRGSNVSPSAFVGIDVRPDTFGTTDARAFRGRALTFLGAVARPQAIKAFTAFSLPEGREPAHLNSWTFLSFRGERGALVPEELKMLSRHDGRAIVNVGASALATMGADDDVFQGLSHPEVGDSVIRRGADIARLLPVLRDRRQRLVPNTGCASCHQMNGLRFDFHNFGYLEDRDLTVSPRVVTDVALDLEWLKRP